MRARRRSWAAIATVAIATACGEAEPTDLEEVGAGRPNVLLYVSDALRAKSLGRYGNPVVETPAIDALAREGTLFENAHAQSSWTRASIASMLTGFYPDVHGAERRDQVLSEGLMLLSERFAEHGYSTAAIIANPNVGSFFGFDQGYDEFIELYGRKSAGHVTSRELIATSDTVTERAIEWIDGAHRPFFLFILTIDPHWPYKPPRRFDRYGGSYSGSIRYGGSSVLRQDLSAADRERIRSFYYGEVSFNDDSFGRLLDHLRARELYDETVVVFTSDHGEEFWEHGGQMHGRALFEESIRIPLIIRYPKAMPVATRVSEPVESVDLFPTLLEMAELPVPQGTDGISLRRPVARGKRTLYARLDLDEFHANAITDFPWKLIRNQRRGRESLFHLERDPGETWDLSAKHPEAAAALSRRLSEQIQANVERRAQLVRGAAPARRSERELPESAREALEALGYIE